MSAEEQQSIPAEVHLDAIGQIAITVSNLSRSTAFYRDQLGIKFLFDAGSMTFFRCGSVRLLLGTGEGRHGDGLAPSTTILYFRVDAIAATHAALLAKGVEFHQPPHLVAKMPGHDLWMAFLKDPDGHMIGLMSEVASGTPAD
jgi:methylmalonyl-CoA/ethylmalonyl-CoA epimerase